MERVVGADSHGHYLPLASACPARDALKNKLKKNTLRQYVVVEVKRAVGGPALCTCERWRLRHSPSVVAGSSADCDCTGNKGQHLMNGVQQAADPAISPQKPCGAYLLDQLRGQGA